MPHHFGAVFDSYWTGTTGRVIQMVGGVDATLLGVYLMSNAHANVLGFYPLPIDAVLAETPIPPPQIAHAFEVLERTEFADYDAATAIVWVRSMARARLGLTDARPGLVSGDKRIVMVNRLYNGLVENPFLQQFFHTYHAALHLNRLRSCDATPKQLTFPQLESAAVRTESTGRTVKITGAPRRKKEPCSIQHQTGFAHFSLYTIVAKEAMLKSEIEDHDDSVANVAEHFKRLCAQRRLDYTGELASDAIAAAVAARRKVGGGRR